MGASTNAETEEKASNERRARLEVGREEVDEPVVYRADGRWLASSSSVLRVEHILEFGLDAHPVDLDDGVPAQILHP